MNLVLGRWSKIRIFVRDFTENVDNLFALQRMDLELVYVGEPSLMQGMLTPVYRKTCWAETSGSLKTEATFGGRVPRQVLILPTFLWGLQYRDISRCAGGRA